MLWLGGGTRLFDKLFGSKIVMAKWDIAHNDDYCRGYSDGMSVDHKHPQTFMFIGYTIEKLAKLIFEYENKENKMTREEVISLFTTATHDPLLNYFNEEKIKVIKGLETLGLIKFDEPKLDLDEKISLKLNKSLTTKQVRDALDMLDHLGYNITKRK